MSPSKYSSRPNVRTLDPENAHDRLIRNSNTTSSKNRRPKKPKSVTDLDVLKAKNQFIRDSNVDLSKLTWEESLAVKYYETLFREYAVVNLKHAKAGAIALRWRTESEVLAEIGHRTCGSLRCDYHQPTIIASLSDDEQEGEQEDEESPLVETKLYEFEVPFGYVEEGTKKSALVKVVLCKSCSKKLKAGREAGKKNRGEVVLADPEVEEGEREDTGRDERRESSRREDRESSGKRRESTSTLRRRSASPEGWP